jgi:hypothetical protein
LLTTASSPRREATLYDDTVRRCLQLSPDQFRLQGPDWAAQVQRITNGEIKRGLGVPENVKVMPQLYKLLLYEAGSFFTPHRDSEKEDGMFGTLAIVLPSSHSGGGLLAIQMSTKYTDSLGKKGIECSDGWTRIFLQLGRKLTRG